MNLRTVFDRLRMSRKPTKKEKDEELDKVIEDNKVNFTADNSTRY